MALTATMHNVLIELADVDRGIYEPLDLRIARQPSETAEYMLMRLIAYCMEYAEGIDLTQGVAAGDEPAVLIRDLTGRVTAWIEVGMPDADRLHRGSKLAGRAAVYTHRNPAQLKENLPATKDHRGSETPIRAFDRAFIEELAALIDRRTELTITITERQLYIGILGRTLHTVIEEHRLEC